MDPTNEPQSEAARETVLPERRAWVRYGCELDVACRSKGPLKDAGWTAKIRNLSRGGLGLVLRHRFQRGTQLVIELRSRDRQFSSSLAVAAR